MELKNNIFVVSLTHWDREWRFPFEKTRMLLVEMIDSMLELLDKDPDYQCFHLDGQTILLEDYCEVRPENAEKLRQYIEQGRIMIGPWYVLPDENQVSGESLVRNFLYGQLIHGRVFGNACRVYGPGDVFGHPNQLSQIARKAGCIGVSWDKLIFNFPPVFNHLALDGRALPHKRDQAPLDEVYAMGLDAGTGNIDQTPPTNWHATLMPTYKQGTCGDYMAEMGD